MHRMGIIVSVERISRVCTGNDRERKDGDRSEKCEMRIGQEDKS